MTRNFNNNWDLEIIRQATANLMFKMGILLHLIIPVGVFCLIIILLGVSMHKVYRISIERTILISIAVVFLSMFICAQLGSFILKLL
ncbi:MAG: hypothetical protein GF329_18615 [Candidatus Lokiarchaeota archaeon]|nr:hypothetical protein [Candidatus Lokiarchaeota archaeon]